MKRLLAGAWVSSFVDRQAVILMYHRVVDLDRDPWSLAVSPRHFDEQLEVLRRHLRILTMDELGTALATRRIPRLAVAITFDDGYADNLHEAKPLLERHDCPATVFMTSGAIGARTEFWWDELERIVLGPDELPATLEIVVRGRVHVLETSGSFRTLRQTADDQRASDPTGSQSDVRQQFYRHLWELLYQLPPLEREKTLEELRKWAGVGSEPRPSHLPLSVDEAVSLTRSGLLRAGAHSHTHTALATLPVAEQRAEIERSRSILEEIVGRQVEHFSYPLGRRCDYSKETVTLVSQAGFSSACSNFPGAIRHDADPYQLPRFYARDWDGDRFARRLLRFLRSGSASS